MNLKNAKKSRETVPLGRKVSSQKINKKLYCPLEVIKKTAELEVGTVCTTAECRAVQYSMNNWEILKSGGISRAVQRAQTSVGMNIFCAKSLILGVKNVLLVFPKVKEIKCLQILCENKK